MLAIIGLVEPITDILELAELLLRLNGRDDVNAILDRLEAGELTVREAVDALRRRLH